jgi:hypothetical protein
LFFGLPELVKQDIDDLTRHGAHPTLGFNLLPGRWGWEERKFRDVPAVMASAVETMKK